MMLILMMGLPLVVLEEVHVRFESSLSECMNDDAIVRLALDAVDDEASLVVPV
jgi:hypothetical protein